MRKIAWTAALGVSCALGVSADELTLHPVRDNSIYAEYPDHSNGAGYLFAGNQGGGQVRRALLRFDVAAALPSGALITTVELDLHVSRASYAEPLPAALHRALADWGEAGSDAGERSGAGAQAQPGDATWSHRFYATQTWGASGGDFAATASATTSLGGIGDYGFASTGALVADVQSWLDAPDQNFGWVLRGDESAPGTARRIDSRESAAATRPELRIVYSVPSAVPFPGLALALLSLALVLFGSRRIARS